MQAIRCFSVNFINAGQMQDSVEKLSNVCLPCVIFCRATIERRNSSRAKVSY